GIQLLRRQGRTARPPRRRRVAANVHGDWFPQDRQRCGRPGVAMTPKGLPLRGAERRRNPHPLLRRGAFLSFLLALLAGCAVPGETPPPNACLLPAQKPMLVAE